MKCKCGLEMEMWQQTMYGGNLIRRYRCACGQEQSEIIEKDKPKYEPPKKDKD